MTNCLNVNVTELDAIFNQSDYVNVLNEHSQNVNELIWTSWFSLTCERLVPSKWAKYVKGMVYSLRGS